MTTLELLKSTREILEKSYIRMVRHDGNGGHCALGAIEAATQCAEWGSKLKETDTGIVPDALRLLGKLGFPIYLDIPMFPIGQGHYALNRQVGGTKLSLYSCASIIATINNCAGKEAILKLFDDAISALEVSELCQQVEKEEKSNGISSDSRVPETVSR